MRRPAHFLAAASLLLIVAIPAARAADGDRELRRNPFERPAPAPTEAAPAGGGAKAPGNPGLRAVLAAGSRSVVNLGGVMMQVGDIENGYELLAVSEGTAVFRNKGKTIVLSLYEQDRGNE